jgi:hypothetical protein
MPGVGQEESELDLGIEAEQRWRVEEGYRKKSRRSRAGRTLR